MIQPLISMCGPRNFFMELLEKNMFLTCSKGPCNFFIKLLENDMFRTYLKNRMHELQGVGLVVGLPGTMSLLLKVLSSKLMKAIS
jgi:hypothetical protein